MIFWTFCVYLFLVKTDVEADVITLTKEKNITCVVTDRDVDYSVFLHPPVKNVILKRLTTPVNFPFTDWNASTTNFGVITDKRWEDLKTRAQTKISINLENKRKYGISVCTSGTLSIVATTKKNKTTKNGEICEKWIHCLMEVKRKKENLYVSLIDYETRKIISNGTFTKYNTSISIKSTTNPTFWKIHTLSYFEARTPSKAPNVHTIQHTGKLCLSMFVQLEKNSKLDVILKSGDKMVPQFVRGNNTKKWQPIKMAIESINQTQISISRKGSGYWAISDINRCSEETEIYHASLPNNEDRQVFCKTLKKHSILKSAEWKNCVKPELIGKNCQINCSNLNSTERHCEGYKICDENELCNCAWGYEGEFCDKSCGSGFWGLNCKSKCSQNCKNNLCHHVTGKCFECKRRFFGDTCSKKFPVLLHPPVLTNISDNSITIKIKTFTFGRDEVPPEYYIVQYKKDNEANFHNFTGKLRFQDYNENTFTIPKLSTKITQYRVRVVLGIENNAFTDNIPELIVYKRTLKIVDVTEKEIYIKWSPPQKHQSANYLLQYKCQENFCKSKQIKEIFVNSATIKIENLRPSSHCMMNITSQKTNQLIDWIKAKTKDARDINENAEFPRLISSRNGEIVVELQKCINFSGPIKYKFKFECLSEWCKNETYYSYDLFIYTESIKLNTTILQPFTFYQPTVLAERSNAKKFKEYNIIQSPPGQPNKVRNLSVYCANNTHLWLRWQHPYPPTGKITNYTIQYKSSGSFMSAHVQHLGPCDLWNGFICAVITNLKSNTSYTIRVRARNEGVSALGIAESIKKYTTQSASQPSRILEVEALNQNEINLTWAHPFFMNGPLTKFSVTVRSNGVVKEHTYDISKYQKNYSLALQLEYYKKYNISVRGINAFEGKEDTVKVILLPPIPRLSPKPFIEVCLKNCSLLVPLSSNAIEHRNFTIFMFEQNEKLTISELCEIFQNFKNNTSTQWIVRRTIKDDKYSHFDIGNNIGQAVSLENKTFKMYLITGSSPDYDIYPLWEMAEDNLRFMKAVASIVFLAILVLFIIFLSYLCYAYITKKFPFEHRRFETEANRRFETDANYYSSFNFEKKPLSKEYEATKIKTVRKKMNSPVLASEMKPFIKDNSTPNANADSHPIKTENLENYLMTCLGEDSENNELTKQFKKLQKNSAGVCTVGSSIHNTAKNRFKNILPYDHSRVILKGNESSDYINANYVEGYENPKGFIATQAPLPSTIIDFWAMIWQEKVTTIVMLTELIENGTVKSAKYWPEHATKFGNILVEQIFSKIFCDYTFRLLEIEKGGETREVKHFQYTTWPDHDVPSYPQNFTPFVRQIIQMPQTKAPIVVHCNAGCGRTGTLILCDIMLRMAAKEKKVDFVKALTKMREQRTGLVSNVDQYIFAHFVVLDCLFGKDFSIKINDQFQNQVEKVLRKTTVKPLMEYVDKLMSQFLRTHSSSFVLSEEDKSKNRFSTILPEYNQIFLKFSTDNPSSYINAVCVDCYRCPKKFIVTQQPLPHTNEDFWRLVTYFQVNTIVSLNEFDAKDATCPQFWPSSTQKISFNSCTVQNLDEYEERIYTSIKLKITGDNVEEKIVNIIKMKNWQSNSPKPGNVKDLLIVWKKMFTTSWKGESKIIVTCHDGVKASGLFVALAFLLEKINFEQICDVFSAVRTVKQSRRQFVEDWAQYEFLYKAAVTYIEEFDNYDNFND